jgi:sugar-specific transcriptional regulator TrmB
VHDAATTQPLVALGFTTLEAETYAFLLRESPVTGYRIAQALRRPAPNIYKALESLEVKGAVLVEDGDSRLCRPVPPDELLSQLERRFREQRARAERVLSLPPEAAGDDRVYTLRSAAQVLERARGMLRRCAEVALADAFPLALEALRPDLESAAARGVQVAVKAYAPAEVAGARVVLDSASDRVLERWPGQWLNLVVDGREHLIAFLTADGRGVRQAVWSGSAVLSWVYHSALSSEIVLDDVRNRLGAGADAAEAARAADAAEELKTLHAPGYRELAFRFADSGPRARRAGSKRAGKKPRRGGARAPGPGAKKGKR